MSSGTVKANGIDLWYEALGDDDGLPLVLVAGLGGQAISWPDEFCWGLADRGFRVIRFDNRDCGLSSFVDAAVDIDAAAAAFLAGEPVAAPYLLDDMAADTVGLLDALGIDAAHLVGASLGGMVGQAVAIGWPERVLSLTSMMAGTGERSQLVPDGDVLAFLLQPPPTSEDEAVAWAVARTELLDSPEHRDEELAAERARAQWRRSARRDGIARQLVAVVASPSREEALPALSVPTLVVHGSADRLVRPEAGRRTAALVAGAELLELEGMGHDLPVVFWAPIIESVTRLAVRAGQPT